MDIDLVIILSGWVATSICELITLLELQKPGLPKGSEGRQAFWIKQETCNITMDKELAVPVLESKR